MKSRTPTLVGIGHIVLLYLCERLSEFGEDGVMKYYFIAGLSCNTVSIISGSNRDPCGSRTVMALCIWRFLTLLFFGIW